MRVSKTAGGLLAVAGVACAAIVQVTPGTVKTELPALKTGRVTGTVLSVYNTPSTFEGIKRGLKEQDFRLLRFPNGSMSNWYHWNGTGKHDSVGIWHADPDKVGPGILTTSRYRGTTQPGSGAGFQSRLTDGLDTTFWWSDPVGAAQPWVQLDFAAETAIDSIRIDWGKIRSDSVEVGNLATTYWNGFGGMDSRFAKLAGAKVEGSSTTFKITSTDMRFLVVKPTGIGADGVQIAEITAWSAGKEVTVKSTSPSVQTPVTAMGAHPGNVMASNWPAPPAWTFAKYLDYIQSMPNVEPLICVNYGTGTAEEAAAWVKYANVDKKLGIKFWEVGNEMDGYWEEGGPVTATQYVNKYLTYARAMKAVDPSIVIFGPVMSTSEFDAAASMQLDGLTWTEEVLRQIGEAEVKDGVRYLDGFDFHAYPYWTAGMPNTAAALTAVRKLKPRLDTLAAMMKRRLQNPGERLVNMSEINLSVVSMDLMVRPENAVGIALALSQLVESNGGNSMSIIWEGFNGGSTGGAANGGTWGTLSLFADPRSGSAASELYAPTSAYWGNWMVSKVWAIDSAKPLLAKITGNATLEAHGLVLGADTSWLLMNTSAKICTTQVSNFASGWIYSFSGAQYTWNGSSDQAYAFPNAGPSGRPIPAGWNHQVILPAFSMAVVRNTPAVLAAPAGEGHVVNLSIAKKQLEVSDTLKITGTLLRAPGAAVPMLKVGDTIVGLQAIDGAWDADQEGFVASIPAGAIGEGVWKVALGASDSIGLTITGVVRPNVWVDRFNDQTMPSELPSAAKWNSWHADELEATSAWDLSFEAREGNSNALRTDAVLVQPADLGYGVLGYTGLALDSALVANSLGIKFDYATRHSSKAGGFALGIPTDTVKDYQDYSITLANTDSSWKTMRVLWSQFTQPSWAKQCGPLQARHINAINFRITGEGKAAMWLDNIALLGTTGDSVSGIKGAARRSKLKAFRVQDAWQIEVPAGSRLAMVGIDGRQLASFDVQTQARSVRYQPVGSGVVYAVLETQGRREQRVLPNIR
jgi:hypothetical protein